MPFKLYLPLIAGTRRTPPPGAACPVLSSTRTGSTRVEGVEPSYVANVTYASPKQFARKEGGGRGSHQVDASNK